MTTQNNNNDANITITKGAYGGCVVSDFQDDEKIVRREIYLAPYTHNKTDAEKTSLPESTVITWDGPRRVAHEITTYGEDGIKMFTSINKRDIAKANEG